MNLKSALGLESSRKICYAIVGLGDISQASLMPGVAHTGNSEITALVTGDPEKARVVAEQYDVPPENTYAYEQFGTLIASGKIDAIYLATPNWRHAEFAVPALTAGIHVLLEKPMEMTVAHCQQIIDAQKIKPGTQLMIAYRLHFEPATLALIDVLRAGTIGTVRNFSSVFSQLVDPKNHRATSGTAAGPLYDMGPYPINAVRNLFEAEPTEVTAVGTRYPDAGLPMDFDHEVAVTLKFPDNQVGQFIVSYVASAVDSFTVTGNKGSLRLDMAYGFEKPKSYQLTVGGKITNESFKRTDHFGGELKAFSDAILTGTPIEPDGQEGLLDVRVLEAAVESLKTGKTVTLAHDTRGRRIDTAQVQKLPAVKPPTEEVNASSPSKK